MEEDVDLGWENESPLPSCLSLRSVIVVHLVFPSPLVLPVLIKGKKNEIQKFSSDLAFFFVISLEKVSD